MNRSHFPCAFAYTKIYLKCDPRMTNYDILHNPPHPLPKIKKKTYHEYTMYPFEHMSHSMANLLDQNTGKSYKQIALLLLFIKNARIFMCR